jgi:hypothetical protein
MVQEEHWIRGPERMADWSQAQLTEWVEMVDGGQALHKVVWQAFELGGITDGRALVELQAAALQGHLRRAGLGHMVAEAVAGVVLERREDVLALQADFGEMHKSAEQAELARELARNQETQAELRWRKQLGLATGPESEEGEHQGLPEDETESDSNADEGQVAEFHVHEPEEEEYYNDETQLTEGELTTDQEATQSSTSDPETEDQEVHQWEYDDLAEWGTSDPETVGQEEGLQWQEESEEEEYYDLEEADRDSEQDEELYGGSDTDEEAAAAGRVQGDPPATEPEEGDHDMYDDLAGPGGSASDEQTAGHTPDESTAAEPARPPSAEMPGNTIDHCPEGWAGTSCDRCAPDYGGFECRVHCDASELGHDECRRQVCARGCRHCSVRFSMD